jgi:hypothetical protein
MTVSEHQLELFDLAALERIVERARVRRRLGGGAERLLARLAERIEDPSALIVAAGLCICLEEMAAAA